MLASENKLHLQQVAVAPKPSGGLRSRFSLVSPAILYLIIMTQIPVLFTLAYSFSNWNLLRPERTQFIGLNNYLNFVQDSDTLVIIRNTLIFASSVVILSLVFGMLLALLLNRQFRGRGLARTLLITPFLIMPTVSAVMWKNMLFSPTFGLINALVSVFGNSTTDWINQYPMASIVVIVTWEWTPFMMLILLAGLQSLSQEHLEAAQIDGAGPLGIFYYVILPHLRRYIEIGVLLEVLFVLNIFGEIFVTTTGGPANDTTTLTFNIYLEAFKRWNVGRASAYGIIAVILANLITFLFLRIIRSNEQQKAGV
ncbi:MAG: carbohydrate ABC transporter permease [Aggregatilineales bacterium]